MNLLPKKSWHVGSAVNRDRVAKDERAHAIETELAMNKAFLKEREARLEHLRARAKLKYGLVHFRGEKKLEENRLPNMDGATPMPPLAALAVPVCRKSNNPNSLAYYLPIKPEPSAHDQPVSPRSASAAAAAVPSLAKQEARGHVNLFEDPGSSAVLAPMAGLTKSQKTAHHRAQLEAQLTTRLGQKGPGKSGDEVPWYLGRGGKRPASAHREAERVNLIESKRRHEDPMTLFRRQDTHKK